MSNKKRTSKRKKHVPNKFEDTICKLNNKKYNDGTRDSIDDRSVDRVLSDDTRDNVKIEEIDKADEGSVEGNESNCQNMFGVAEEEYTKSCFVSDSHNKIACCDKGENNGTKSVQYIRSSYAKVLTTSEADLDRDLCVIPTCTSYDGSDVVIFDEELVQLGSAKWNMTICGYFVGKKMHFIKLKYNLVRMWSRFGLGEIFTTSNDVFCFEFRQEHGMKYVLENSPWMMYDVPLEAWTSKGIRTQASGLGKPITMDDMTAKMCQYEKGRIGYARVLVKVSAEKEFKDFIKIEYMDNKGNMIRTKKVNVEYSWKPDVCKHCNSFGHNYLQCSKMPKSLDEIREEQDKEKKKKEEGKFVQNWFNWNQQQSNKWTPQGYVGRGQTKKGNMSYKNDRGINKVEYMPVTTGNGNADKNNNKRKAIVEEQRDGNSSNNGNSKRTSPIKECNQFAVLDGYDDGIKREINSDQKKEVEYFINQRLQPSPFEINKWSNKVVNYFKSRWEEMNVCEDLNDDIEDVMKDTSGSGKFMGEDEIEGINGFIYAANHGKERKDLWSDLGIQKRFSNGFPWALLDLYSSGFQFTWSKSPLNPKACILKKLDRVMVNEKFLDSFQKAHAIFLPYIISDHCPALLTIPDGAMKQAKPIRFVNHIADKQSFLQIVEDGFVTPRQWRKIGNAT
ncbi:RNA-directed DNA polymerase, eukaryota, reverse transcriptase zinc-binding domain protein [Tanacetum coccineum]